MILFMTTPLIEQEHETASLNGAERSTESSPDMVAIAQLTRLIQLLENAVTHSPEGSQQRLLVDLFLAGLDGGVDAFSNPEILKQFGPDILPLITRLVANRAEISRLNEAQEESAKTLHLRDAELSTLRGLHENYVPPFDPTPFSEAQRSVISRVTNELSKALDESQKKVNGKQLSRFIHYALGLSELLFNGELTIHNYVRTPNDYLDAYFSHFDLVNKREIGLVRPQVAVNSTEDEDEKEAQPFVMGSVIIQPHLVPVFFDNTQTTVAINPDAQFRELGKSIWRTQENRVSVPIIESLRDLAHNASGRNFNKVSADYFLQFIPEEDKPRELNLLQIIILSEGVTFELPVGAFRVLGLLSPEINQEKQVATIKIDKTCIDSARTLLNYMLGVWYPQTKATARLNPVRTFFSGVGQLPTGT